MRRSTPRAFFVCVALLSAFCVGIVPLRAQGEAGAAAEAGDLAPMEVEKVFGTPGLDAPGSEGFRVVFDRRGAAVKTVNLLDHGANAANEDGARDEYLLSDILWVDPALQGQGFYTWLGLRETVAGARTFEGVDPLTAPWAYDGSAADAALFSIDLGDGVVLEKNFRYETGRRDLLIEIALRSTADSAKVGREVAFTLRGLAVRSPRSEYTLGQNVARAVGQTLAPDGTPEFSALSADGDAGIDDESRGVLAMVSVPGMSIDFAGSTNRFFGSFLYPATSEDAARLRSATLVEFPNREQSDTPVFTIPVVEYTMTLDVPAAGQASRAAFRLYMGPKSNRVFEQNSEYGRFAEIVSNDLQPGCFCEIPGQRPMAKFLLWLLGKLYDIVGNWGVAIMILTVLVRGALVPVNFRMQKSMRVYGAKAAKLKPKLDAIQKKHANDKKQLQMAMMEFQRENKLFPPLGGCLPMFVTIPVFIGLFTALRTSYDLRQQPFILWIDDLSQPDALFMISGYNFNLLPLIMVGLWWFLQSSTPLPTDPQQRQMMKIMRFMPFMFGIMLYGYASGLMVYMITSSLFAIVEQRVTKKLLGPMSAEAGAFATPTI